MITAIDHQGLEKFYRTGNTAGIDAAQAKMLRFILLSLDSACYPQDLVLPNIHLSQQQSNYRLSGEFGTLHFCFQMGAVQIRAAFTEAPQMPPSHVTPAFSPKLEADTAAHFQHVQALTAETHLKMHNPPHIGETITALYLQPLGISLREMAQYLDVSASTLSRLLNGNSNLSPEMALRLAKTLGRSAESWLLMQSHYDLWQAKRRVSLLAVSRLYPERD